MIQYCQEKGSDFLLLFFGGLIVLIKLDYTLENPEDRNELVKKVLEDNPEPNEKYLEILADYLILCMEKQEKKEKKILTENRMTTVNKRETSFEGLVSQFENGEDGIYNLITNNKNVIFQPKITTIKTIKRSNSYMGRKGKNCKWQRCVYYQKNFNRVAQRSISNKKCLSQTYCPN